MSDVSLALFPVVALHSGRVSMRTLVFMSQRPGSHNEVASRASYPLHDRFTQIGAAVERCSLQPTCN